jgi:hypothetical protein
MALTLYVKHIFIVCDPLLRTLMKFCLSFEWNRDHTELTETSSFLEKSLVKYFFVTYLNYFFICDRRIISTVFIQSFCCTIKQHVKLTEKKMAFQVSKLHQARISKEN